jgi:hypothetical protein
VEAVYLLLHKRSFLLKIERLLNAAAGHEGNVVPSGNQQYQVLNARADSIWTEFADRWGLDRNLLMARIPGLAKLAGLSVPPPAKNNARLAGIGMIAVPLALFLLGIMAGLVSLGFHLVEGRWHDPSNHCRSRSDDHLRTPIQAGSNQEAATA